MCGDKHAGLRELELRYWQNPNQVYLSGLKDNQFKLANARSICLLDCPIPSEDSLSWVCDYPGGDIRVSMSDWIDMNYDYFEFLTPEMRNSSLQLQGPCYPVIFPSVNGKKTFPFQSITKCHVLLYVPNNACVVWMHYFEFFTLVAKCVPCKKGIVCL